MQKTDLFIIGAGTAGLSAAIYAARSGLSCLIAESNVHGGQILNTPDIENYPALPKISGFDFVSNLYTQATGLGAQVAYGTVSEICPEGAGFRAAASFDEVHAKAIIIANGARHRRLGCPGEEAFAGKGVSYCATCDGAFFRGKTVLVAGGGNTALEDALFLSNLCQQVILVHRREAFRAHKKTVEQVLKKENIRILYNTQIQAISGGDTVSEVRLIQENRQLTEPVSGVFIAVGLEPNNGIFANLVELDQAGYIKAGADCITTCPGIFAAGDTRTTILRQLITAAADGAVAATQAGQYIETHF